MNVAHVPGTAGAHSCDRSQERRGEERRRGEGRDGA